MFSWRIDINYNATMVFNLMSEWISLQNSKPAILNVIGSSTNYSFADVS